MFAFLKALMMPYIFLMPRAGGYAKVRPTLFVWKLLVRIILSIHKSNWIFLEICIESITVNTSVILVCSDFFTENPVFLSEASEISQQKYILNNHFQIGPFSHFFLVTS
jgi:hypothetical protein